MAATITITGTEALTTSITDCRAKLENAEQVLQQTQREIAEESDKLADLQVSRERECEQMASGRKSDPAKFDPAIRRAEDRLIGLAAIQRTRERDVADLKTTFYDLEAARAKIENQQADERELRETQKLIEEAKRAVAVRNESERIFLDALITLRSRKYRVSRNRELAFAGAEAAQRNWNGMRA